MWKGGRKWNTRKKNKNIFFFAFLNTFQNLAIKSKYNVLHDECLFFFYKRSFLLFRFYTYDDLTFSLTSTICLWTAVSRSNK